MLSHLLRAVRCGALLSLSWLAVHGSVAAQAQVTLGPKFVEGRKTVMHTTMKLKQTLTLAGMNLETDSDRFVITEAQAGQRDAEGRLRIEQKVNKLSLTAKLPGGIMLAFDSDDPDRKSENPLLEPILQVMRAAAKAKTMLVRDASGKVVAVEGLDKASEGLPEEFKGDFDAEQVKKTVNQELERLPKDSVKVGDTWTRNSDLPLGSGQIMSLTTEYKYLGETKDGDKTFDKIEAKTTAVSFSIAETSKLPLKVTKSELKPTESGETLLFDRAAGQVHSTKGQIRIQGTLDFTINGVALPGKLDLTIESETTRQP